MCTGYRIYHKTIFLFLLIKYKLLLLILIFVKIFDKKKDPIVFNV